MSYIVEFTSYARKDLKKIPAVEVSKILNEIERLQFNPRPTNSKKLKNSSAYRVRTGNIYEIEDKKLLILVIKIGHRKDIYK